MKKIAWFMAIACMMFILPGCANETAMNEHEEGVQENSSAYHKIEGEYLFGYLNKTSLCAFLGGTVKPLGRSTINDWIREKNFPKPIVVSQTVVFWRPQDVIKWVESLPSANDDQMEKAE